MTTTNTTANTCNVKVVRFQLVSSDLCMGELFLMEGESREYIDAEVGAQKFIRDNGLIQGASSYKEGCQYDTTYTDYYRVEFQG